MLSFFLYILCGLKPSVPSRPLPPPLLFPTCRDKRKEAGELQRIPPLTLLRLMPNIPSRPLTPSPPCRRGGGVATHTSFNSFTADAEHTFPPPCPLPSFQERRGSCIAYLLVSLLRLLPSVPSRPLAPSPPCRRGGGVALHTSLYLLCG